MRRGFVAIFLASSLTVCGADPPVPPSPGVALVANATASGLPTIAEFGAANCASCREMKIVLDGVARKTAGKANVLVIDIGKDYEAAQAFCIQLMPTQIEVASGASFFLPLRFLNWSHAMKNIKVLGTGCANCKTTLKLIEETAAAKGVAVQIEKVEDLKDIMSYGVMSTPGVVVDGKVVHAGGIPSREKIESWLA